MKFKPATLRMMVGIAVMLAAFSAVGRFMQAKTQVKFPHDEAVQMVDVCTRVEAELAKFVAESEKIRKQVVDPSDPLDPAAAARRHTLDVEMKMCAAKSRLVGYIKKAALAEVIVKKEWDTEWAILIGTAADFEADKEEDVAKVAAQLKVPGIVGMKVPKGMVHFLGYMKLKTGLPKDANAPG